MSKIVPGVYCSTTGSPLGAAMTAAAELRGIDVMSAPLEPAPLPDGVSALLLDDFLAALMLRPDPGNAVDALPGADAMARLEELVGRGLEAGVTRIVAISAPRRPQGGLPLSVIAAAREFEALLARAGAGHAVVLRTLEVSDPMAGATQAVVRRLLRGDGFASAASDPFQGVALSDLAMAAAAAATVRDVDGRHLDIVAHQAVSRRHMAQETERLGRLLSNPDLTEVSARPSYGAEPALLDARPAALALHVAPQETAWTMLARTTQELVRYACEMGDLPPKVPPMSRVHEALETGALPLAGKHVVLSGASHPIGQAAAIMLLRLGANVTGIVRNSEAGAALAARCAEERPAWQRLRLRHARLAAQTGRCPQPCGGEAGGLQIESADLSDLTAVRALAARMHARHPRLDAVVHAGLLTLPQRRETAQGHETLFAANVLSPLMLTRLLAEPLVAAGQAGGAWVVNMVAPGHAEAPLNLDDLHSRWAYVPETVLARAAQRDDYDDSGAGQRHGGQRGACGCGGCRQCRRRRRRGPDPDRWRSALHQTAARSSAKGPTPGSGGPVSLGASDRSRSASDRGAGVGEFD